MTSFSTTMTSLSTIMMSLNTTMTSPNFTTMALPNFTTATSPSHYYYSSITSIKTIVLPIIFSVVFVVGIIGNGLVIYIMKMKVRTRNITDLYILNLAVADFIFVAMLPFWTVDLAMDSRWVFGRVLCKLASASTLFHMYASVFFLAAMSVDRFIAVVLYQKCGKYRTKEITMIGITVIWLMSTVLGILPLYFRDTMFNNSTGTTSCEWMLNQTRWLVMHYFMRSFIGFVLPFLVILVCYSIIIIFLKTRETHGRLTSKYQDRATKMVLVVIAVFLFCWLPNQISNSIYVAQNLGWAGPSTHPMRQYYIHMFASCLAWMHSCINPILYAFMREDLRLKLTEMMNYKRSKFDFTKSLNKQTAATRETVVRFQDLAQQMENDNDEVPECIPEQSSIDEKQSLVNGEKLKLRKEFNNLKMQHHKYRNNRDDVTNNNDDVTEFTDV